MKSQELSTESGKRIVISTDRSKFIITLITAIHVGAISLLFFVDLSAWLLLAVALLILLHLFSNFTFNKSSTHSLSFQAGESMLLKMNHSSWREIDIVESFVTNWMVVLRVRTLSDSRLHSLVYAADSMNCYSFRQLRIYLNYYNAAL